jgi:hypothetical protein
LAKSWQALLSFFFVLLKKALPFLDMTTFILSNHTPLDDKPKLTIDIIGNIISLFNLFFHTAQDDKPKLTGHAINS